MRKWMLVVFALYVVVTSISLVKLVEQNNVLQLQNEQLNNHITELSTQIIRLQNNIIVGGHPELANSTINDEEEK